MALPKSGSNTLHAPSVLERRRYTRFPFVSPVRLRELNEAVEGIPAKPKRSHAAKIKNLGQGGAKVTALPALTPHAKVLIHMNLKPLSVAIDTRDLLFVSIFQASSHEGECGVKIEMGVYPFQSAQYRVPTKSNLTRYEEGMSESGKQILAEVVWRHLNLETGLFEAGLRFIEGWRRRDYESYITSAEQSS